jgi:hypothetical protein
MPSKRRKAEAAPRGTGAAAPSVANGPQRKPVCASAGPYPHSKGQNKTANNPALAVRRIKAPSLSERREIASLGAQ